MTLSVVLVSTEVQIWLGLACHRFPFSTHQAQSSDSVWPYLQPLSLVFEILALPISDKVLCRAVRRVPSQENQLAVQNSKRAYQPLELQWRASR